MSIIFMLFIFSLTAVLYTWGLYPFIIFLIRLRKGNLVQVGVGFYLPSISVVVAAYNEEKAIAARIENLLAQDYPKDKLEIIVASDGSRDRTVEIANRYPEVKVLGFQSNRGRASVHNDAVVEATGEIVVFTDAETIFAKDFLRNAIVYFNDSAYGCGAGDFTFKPLGNMGDTEGLYWRMEKMIRRWEFHAGCLPFASGGCFLIRRDLFSPISPHSDIDNILPLRVIEVGKKVFYAQDAKAYDVTVSNSVEHYKKRVRTAQRSMTDILSMFPILWNKKRYSTLLVLVSHRLLRWLTGYFWGILLLSNIAMVLTSPGMLLGNFFLGLQVVFYLFVLLGWLDEKKVHFLPPHFRKINCAIYSFALANVAFLVAVWRVASGEKIFSYKS